MDNRLSLLTLPANALKNVLLNMEFQNVLTLSLVSKRTHSLISKNWLRPPWGSRLCFGTNYVSLSLWFVGRTTTIDFYPINGDGHSSLENTKHFEFAIDEPHTTYRTLEVSGIAVTKCIQKFIGILNMELVEELTISSSCTPETTPATNISKFLEGLLYKRFVMVEEQSDFIQSIFQLLSFPEQYEIFDYPAIEPGYQQNVFMESSQCLMINGSAALAISFDELMSMNSEYIDLEWCALPDKFINRFLKLWIKGCHRRLQNLQISVCEEEIDNRNIDENVVMRGIHYQMIPGKRKFPIPYEYRMDSFTVMISSGLDIVRNDGKATATISIEGSNLKMFVTHH